MNFPGNLVKTIGIALMSLISILTLTHCATDKELEVRSMNRFVHDGVYRNKVKGFEMDWPSERIWQFNDTPEFDLGFDHIDGQSQFYIIGVRGLIRKSFPDGFVDWILDRLQARTIQTTAHKELTTDLGQMFQVFLECKFMILPRDQFGVDRKVCVYALRNEPYWIGLIYISPKDSFDNYIPDIEKVVDSIRFLTD